MIVSTQTRNTNNSHNGYSQAAINRGLRDLLVKRGEDLQAHITSREKLVTHFITYKALIESAKEEGVDTGEFTHQYNVSLLRALGVDVEGSK
jgi:hypothetical protein